MPENRLSALKRLWSPSRTPGDAPAVAFRRVWLVAALIGVLAMVLAPAAFLCALFLHVPGSGTAGIAVLAVYLASRAVLEAFRIRWVLHIGHWTGWKGEPIRRNEQPVRFWIRAALHGLALAICVAGAAILIWAILGQMAGR